MLYVFVEGSDDEKFINRYFNLNGYDSDLYHIIPYAQKKQKDVNGFIKTINKMQDCDYILLADADAKEVDERKQLIRKKYCSLSIEKIYIVKNEIESWYLAGLSEESSRELKLKCFQCTDSITKEEFDNYIGKNSRIIVLARILDLYCITVATQKNTTFKEFHESRIYEKCK